MSMTEKEALDALHAGLWELSRRDAAWVLRNRYLIGECDLPWAPEGVSEEYEALRKAAVAPWLYLVMGAPVQRLNTEGVQVRGANPDAPPPKQWDTVWTKNKLGRRQNSLYLDMLVHGEGILGVWPLNGGRVRVAVESCRNIWREPDPEDSTADRWQLKVWTEKLPGATASGRLKRRVAVVHDHDGTFWRFTSSTVAGEQGVPLSGWDLVGGQGSSGTGELPFIPYVRELGTDGKPWPAITPLIPAQDAINTVRFNSLLTMQYSAYRQRIITNMDPVVRDADGEPIWQKNADGTDKIDAVSGLRIPLVQSLGRASVDRMLVVNGDSKVYDMPESNLGNYIALLQELTTDLFARGQVPPQYLLSRMANLSGDALAGAESTLSSLASDLQQVSDEGHQELFRRASIAAGMAPIEVRPVWAEVEARSFAQIVDAIVKLMTQKFPRRGAWAMLPGATPELVDEWVQLADAEAEQAASWDPLTAAMMRADPSVAVDPGAVDTGAAAAPAVG